MATTTFELGTEPRWILINNEGTTAGGGLLFTYHSLNKVLQKPVFKDPAGQRPWTNPIVFDLNGVQGPFYFEVDSSDPEDTYYLEAYEAPTYPNDRGPLLWTEDHYSPGTSGGGSDVTVYLQILNYITNNQFIDHIPDAASTSTNLVIAASNHKGFTPALINPIVGTYGVVGPDIRFVKSNASATDAISFPLFPLASAPLTGDVTPVDYVRYLCTASPVPEDYKCFQFPITQKVKNLSNQEMTFGLWGAVTATPAIIKVYLRQYFGSGSAASPDTRTLIGTFTLSTTWTWNPFGFTVPDVSGMSIGTPGSQTDDDAVYIQVEMPLGQACDVLFTKPALYLGDVDPNLDFESYDQIDSINSTPRTGDVKATYLTTVNPGWVGMNDLSIGNIGSGATNAAGAFTFQLYKTLWDSVSNTYAPVSGGRGASAVADFIANKTLTLPLALGRAMSNTGQGAGLTFKALGENEGAESQSVTLISANLPPHSHDYGLFTAFVGGGLGLGLSQIANTVVTGTGPGPGTSTPFVVSIIQPTTHMNFFIKL